jgi:hypothetical protein
MGLATKKEGWSSFKYTLSPQASAVYILETNSDVLKDIQYQCIHYPKVTNQKVIGNFAYEPTI